MPTNSDDESCERSVEMSASGRNNDRCPCVLADRHVGYIYQSNTVANEVVAAKNEARPVSTSMFPLIVLLLTLSRC